MMEDRRRTVGFAPFGHHTFYMLTGYLRHVLIVTAVLLAIALTIDLWPQYQMVASAGGPGGLGSTWSVIRFCALRTPGLVAPFLPFATFLGVIWTEVIHTRSGERMLVWNSGRSPLQCLMPALLLGLILGGAEFVMDGYLGPASMDVQMAEKLGRDGQRLDRHKLRETSWISASGDLIRAEIEYGPPPVLHNLIMFDRDGDGKLTAVLMAKTARHLSGSNMWLLQDGQNWSTSPKSKASLKAEAVVPFTEKTIALHVDPVWLSVYGLQPQYIPLATLYKLRPIDRRPDFKGSYRTRLNVVYGEILLPGAMAILAAALAMLLMAYDTTTASLVSIVFAGYVAHFGTKACLTMGQNGYMSPELAGWLVPSLLVVACAGVIAISEMKRINAS